MINFLSKYQYADVREVTETLSSIRIKDDEIRPYEGISFGISVRVLANGAWGFASGTDTKEIKELLKKAEKLASISKGDVKLAEVEIVKSQTEARIQTIPTEEKIKRLLDAKKEMDAKEIKNRILGLNERIIEKRFCSSEGSEILQKQVYTYLSIQAIGKRDTVQVAHERQANTIGFEKIDANQVAKKANEKIKRILNAKLPPKGTFTVVLNPEMTGVLSHEAIGHACEADAVIENESILEGKLGAMIGNEMVNIIDDPIANDFGHYAYDDEGVAAKKATLIENGVVRGYLLSRETAHQLGMQPNGHTRAETYSDFPIVRMGNTYFQPGTAKKEDVFDVRDGIYLKGMLGGSVDIFSGGFMFKAEEAFRIKNGEISEQLRDVAIIGNILETLKKVEIVGNDFETSPGVCGKGGQKMPVSDGGPHIRVKDITIG
ncbi:MAG: TldD/PmbA family protein [Candidatus Micrarchaeota archaeon]